jgi:histidine triad (HIT) family protein
MAEDCIFCRIIAGEIPATFVRREHDLVAIQDANPQAPTHLLVIPREHVPMAIDLKAAHAALLGRVFEVAAAIARERGLEDGYRLVVNNGAKAGQTVFHLHFHLLGGRGMKWPPG